MFEKIIFADIDGPLATTHCSEITHKTKWSPYLYRMDIRCVNVLNEIITETNADIVVSSDWRRHFSLEELGEIFEWNEIIKKPIDVTPIAPITFSDLERNRINEISIWVKEHLPDRWVVFDDLHLGCEKIPNFVLCEDEDGIAAKGLKQQIIKYLI